MGLLDDAFRAIRFRFRTSEPSPPAAPFVRGPGPTQEELGRILPQLFELRTKYRAFVDPFRNCDRGEAEAAVQQFYRAMQLSQPPLDWCPSPLAAVRAGILWSAFRAFNAAQSESMSDIIDRLTARNPMMLHDRVGYSRLHVQTRFHAFNAAVTRAVDLRDFFNQRRAQIDVALYKAIEDSLCLPPEDCWKPEFDALLEHGSEEDLRKFSDWFWSAHPERRAELLSKSARHEFNSNWETTTTSLAAPIAPTAATARFESGNLLVGFTVESLTAWNQKLSPEFLAVPALTEHCPWWRAELDICILSDGPVEVHRDDSGRLHRFDGPAVRYSDGFSLYYIRGIRVWEDTAHGRFTAEDIDAERNVEFRRAMIERFGTQNYLATGAYTIGEDEYGVLYRKNVEGDEPITIVKVKNSTPEPDGSFKEYFLRVPPHMQTPAQAVAWTFDMDEEEYYPEVET